MANYYIESEFTYKNFRCGVKETLKCVTAKYVPAESVDEWLKEHNSKLDFYGNRWWVK